MKPVALFFLLIPGILMTDANAISASGLDLGWYVVNDNVMGGRSEGSFEQEQEQLKFQGRTNTNGGGFSSIRTKTLQMDLSTYTGIELSVKGDGRRYTWRLATDARWRGNEISYWADFETQDGVWSTVKIPFASFVPRYRGNELDGPALDTAHITGMGLMIYDNQDGPFELQLASIRSYRADPPFSLRQYQWQKRVLVISATSNDDPNLRAQRNAVTSTIEEFADRDMVLVTLLDDGVSTAGERQLTIKEADRIRMELRIEPASFAVRLIGKDGSIKLAAQIVTSMTEIYALIDGMPMRRREQRNDTDSAKT